MHFEHKSHFTAAACHRTQTHTQNLKPPKITITKYTHIFIIIHTPKKKKKKNTILDSF